MYMRPNQSQIDSTTRPVPIASFCSQQLASALSCKYRAGNSLRNGDLFRRIFLPIPPEYPPYLELWEGRIEVGGTRLTCKINLPDCRKRLTTRTSSFKIPNNSSSSHEHEPAVAS